MDDTQTCREAFEKWLDDTTDVEYKWDGLGYIPQEVHCYYLSWQAAWNTSKEPTIGWMQIDSAPIGSNGDKKSHIILINKYGNICRGYKIHDGTGEYAMHDPFYNEHGQTFHPVMWMPLPAAPVDKSAEVG